MSKSVKIYSMFTEAFNSPATNIYVPGHDTVFSQKNTRNIQNGLRRVDNDSDQNAASVQGEGRRPKEQQKASHRGTDDNQQPYSVLSDLAHVLVDIRFTSQCSALTGAGDSGMTQLMHASMCVMGNTSRESCPQFIDITKAQPPGSTAQGV
jgi:hypothetical protein